LCAIICVPKPALNLAKTALLRYSFSLYFCYFILEAIAMKNPLESVTGTIVSGLVLTVVLVFFLKNFLA
jgi:hypothetical protein